MSFILSTLEPFQTILAPTVKTSNVQFYKKPNAGSRLGSAINAPFTRAGAGRKVIDASGNLVDAAANVPAWTFPIGGSSAGCPYLSFLPSVENLLTYSEEFDNAAWTKTTTTITANAATSPDGTTNADNAEFLATSSRITQSATVTSGATGTISLFVKKAGAGTDFDWFRLQIDDASSNGFRCWLNLTDGYKGSSATFGTANVDDFDIIDFGDYYFIYLQGDIPSATTYNAFLAAVDGDTSLTTVVNSQIDLWGAMLKEGSYISPLDYIPTTTAAVTRSFDDLTDITDLQTAGYLPSATEGSIIFNFKYNGSNGSVLIGPQFENSSNVDQFAFVTRTTGLGFFDYVNGAYAWQDNTLSTEGELQRLIACWDASGLKVYLNGFLVYSNTGSFSITRFEDIDSNFIELGFKMLNFAPTALTANQAEAASSWPSFDLMVSDLGYS